MNSPDWFSLQHPNKTDSPALLVYPERIRYNIQEMIRIAGSPDRLAPHIKTHKMSSIINMQLEQGINRFKCATIAEAEMLCKAGAKEIVLAYQLNEPKTERFLQLIKNYPHIRFISLIDNMPSAVLLNLCFAKANRTAEVFLDLDNGMHRTGFPAGGDIVSFYTELNGLSNIHCRGFHVYDGHIRGKDFEERKEQCRKAFSPIERAATAIETQFHVLPEIIAGGSPTFPIHALNPRVSCSPGTCLLWDKGYSEQLKEQPFLHAAVVLTRIISKPVSGRITTDLGHKSVAAENPIDRRISFLNLESYQVVSQSEEHLVLEINPSEWKEIPIGKILYGIPYHICPTVALYDEVQVVENGIITDQWKVEARKKRITV